MTANRTGWASRRRWADGVIGFADPRWHATFPHLVTPLEDEWLVGLVLRCDLVNGWSAGTTGRSLRRLPTPQNVPERLVSAFATARTLDLTRFAELLAVPLPSLQQTTFADGLARLQTPDQATPRRIMIGRPFRVCPACIAARQLLARSHVLPLIDTCLEHGMLLQQVCACGVHLRPFHQAEPFTCPECRVPWRELPLRCADGETIALNARLLTLFRFFLEQGNADSFSNALRAASVEMVRRGLYRLPPLPREAAVPGYLWEQMPVSLTRVVGALAALGLAPEAVQPAGRSRVPASQVPCRNHTCPRFGLIGAGNVHPLRRRAGTEYYYCAECGSHFSQDRLSSSFDTDCHSSEERGPSPRKVAQQQARLAAWRKAIEPVCIQMLAEDVPISVATAFRRAKIPRTPTLRAPRLGLANVVEQYAALQTEGARGQILTGWREGMTRAELAQTVGVSLMLVRQVVSRQPRSPKGPVGRPRRIAVEQHGLLWAQLEANPEATILIQVRLWSESQGTTVGQKTMRDAIRRLGWNRIRGRWTPPKDTKRDTKRASV